jgi:hypothetical protein
VATGTSPDGPDGDRLKLRRFFEVGTILSPSYRIGQKVGAMGHHLHDGR